MGIDCSNVRYQLRLDSPDNSNLRKYGYPPQWTRRQGKSTSYKRSLCGRSIGQASRPFLRVVARSCRRARYLGNEINNGSGNPVSHFTP